MEAENDCVCWRGKLGAQKYNICCLFLLPSLTHRVNLPNLFLKGFAESFTEGKFSFHIVTQFPLESWIADMEIRSTWHSFVQMQMLASDVNEATIASYSHVNLSTFSVARPESLLWSWRNNRRKSGESWTINHNQSFISQSVKEDDQQRKERMNVLLEESCQKSDLNYLTFSYWSNFLLPYLLDLVSNHTWYL